MAKTPDTPTPGAPGDLFDVTRFGALGDGVTIATDAINQAIEAAASRQGGAGGTVHHPVGTYASYSIHLQSNVALYLAEGATLLAAPPTDSQGYDPAEPGADNPFQDFGHSNWHNSLIWGERLENITIYGPGAIDGNGLVAGGDDESAPWQSNKAIALKLCRNVTIRDVTIVRGGHFCILPTGVDNFRIDSLVIDTNRDGINLHCCRNVHGQLPAGATLVDQDQFLRCLLDRIPPGCPTILSLRSRVPSADVLDLIGPHVEANTWSSSAAFEMSDLKSAVDQHSLALPESRGVFGLTTGNGDPEPLPALFATTGRSGSNLVHRDPELAIGVSFTDCRDSASLPRLPISVTRNISARSSPSWSHDLYPLYVELHPSDVEL